MKTRNKLQTVCNPIITVLFLIAFFTNGIFAAGWISPDGYNDPYYDWSTESAAYDGNVNTYASNPSSFLSWGGFIELTLSSPIQCGMLRIKADYDTSYVTKADIDVYKDGAWVNVHNGSITNAAWQEFTFDEGTVTKARFRYRYKWSSVIMWLYELEFYESAAEITTPACITESATSVEEDIAILHGTLTDDGGEQCEWRVQYGTSTAYEYSTEWQGSCTTDETLNKQLTSLANNQTYHYRMQVRNSAGIGSGNNMQFTTGTPSTGWVSASGFSDPSNSWDNETRSYDDSLTLYASSYHEMDTYQWSDYLYFNHSEMSCDGIRFYARGPTSDQYYVDRVDVDVYKNGSWINVYEGSFSSMQWVEKNFTEGTVSQARIRFRVNSSATGLYFELYELDFHRVANISISGAHDGSTPVTLAINGVV
jgi:hypothetical protein